MSREIDSETELGVLSHFVIQRIENIKENFCEGKDKKEERNKENEEGKLFGKKNIV